MHTSVKWIRNIIIFLLVLVLLFIIILNTQFAKNLIRGKLEAYLTTKTGGKFHIARINYRLPTWIEMNGVSVQSKAGDTLLTGKKLAVEMKLFKAINGEYDVNRLELDSVYLDVNKKEGDSTFNFQFIIDAFTSKLASARKDTAPVVMTLKEIHINNSTFRWKDPSTGVALNTRIGKLDMLIDSFNISKNRYSIRESAFADMFFDMHIYAVPAQQNTNVIPVALPFITILKSHIKRTHFIYKDDNTGINTDDVITDLRVNNFNLHSSGSVRADKVLLANSDMVLNRYPLENAVVRKDTVTGAIIIDSLGVLHIKELVLQNDNIIYNVTALPRIKGFDINHINLKHFTAYAKNIDYTGKYTNVNVRAASGIDKSGLVLDSLHGNFAMVVDSSIRITDLYVQTPRSKIQGSALVYPYSLMNAGNSAAQNKIDFKDNIISKADLQLLLPGIANTYAKQLQGISTLYVTAQADGNAKRAVIHRLTLRSNRNDVYLDGSGLVTNALSKNGLLFNARIYQLNVTRNVLQGFLDKKTNQQISLPPSMHIKGTVSGSRTELLNNLTANSAYGNAAIQGRISNFMSPKNLSYNLKLVARNLETGKWIKQDSLFGKVNGTISAKGSGTDYKTANIQSVVDLSSLRVMKHNYTGIQLHLSGNKGNYDFTGRTRDPLLQLSLKGNASLNKQYPSVKSFIDIQNANPYALGLYKDSFSFKTKANIDLKNLDPALLNAFVRLDSTVVYKNSNAYRMDSLLLTGYIDSGKTNITMRSAPADATLKGVYRYTELGGIFQQYMAKYFNSKVVTNAPVKAYSIDMAIDVKPDPLYAVLIPGLFFDKNMALRGRLDDSKTDSTRYLDLSVPGLIYQGNTVAGLRAHATDMGDSLRFTAIADTVEAGSVLLYTTSLQGSLLDKRLSAKFSTNDKDQKERYAFSISGSQFNDLYQVQLANQLKLNYENWQVTGKSNLLIGKKGINVEQFSISKGAEKIEVNSITRELNAPLDLKIDQFAIHNITTILNTGSLQLDGIVNASVRVSDIEKNIPTLDGTLSIDSLVYQNMAMGKLDLKATTVGNSSVTLTGALAGYGNNVDLKGTYNQKTIDALLNLNPMQFKTIEPFTLGALVNSSGTLTGPIRITGNVKSPEWNGLISFNDASTKLKQLGTVVRLDGQTIELKYPNINFNQFTIKDSTGHELVVNGALAQNSRQELSAALSVKTTDFTVLNNRPADNNQLYGTATVDADITINGPLTTPDIAGSVALKDRSNITFVRQQIIASAKDRENVMQFVDMDTVKNEFIIPPAERPQSNDGRYAYLNYDLNIDISKEAQFNIIVDPLTRDVLQVRGVGQFNAGVSPNGAISITGAYNLTKGSYQLNYQFLKRKFELQEGSTIVLTGDPADADADITAVYEIEASPYELIRNEVSDNAGLNTNLYRQKVPFQVFLHIKGKALAPTLEFDVKMKENVAGISSNFSTTIDNKLVQLRGDAAGMNKQVFGLLVMGRFIGEQSTDFLGSIGGEGFSAKEIVRESVSRFLSDAMNNIASNLIKGVDINVDLRNAEDYSTASRHTDINVALSKRFMNDRLNVTVGKSFTVSGDDPSTRGGSEAQFLPDITTTYKLSIDGRYMMKAYQRNQYEAILDGYFIETGVAFTLVMDYNKFNELIRKKKK